MTKVDLQSLSRGERKKIKTRDALLVAAQELILEKGVRDVTVNQITESADIPSAHSLGWKLSAPEEMVITL